jgi:hypothetical protein
MHGRLTPENAATIALNALGFLANSPQALDGFMQQSGVDLTTIRATAAERDLLVAVLDFVMANEELLVDFCESSRTEPRAVQMASHVLGAA